LRTRHANFALSSDNNSSSGFVLSKSLLPLFSSRTDIASRFREGKIGTFVFWEEERVMGYNVH
jgi:hypothetical protein